MESWVQLRLFHVSGVWLESFQTCDGIRFKRYSSFPLLPVCWLPFFILGVSDARFKHLALANRSRPHDRKVLPLAFPSRHVVAR